MEVPASTAVPPQGQGEGKEGGGEREERILARRKRVAAKLEAKKRAEAGEEAQEVEEEEVDLEKERKSRQQVDKSELRLDKLSTDATELVTNVVAAQDAKEVAQRQEEEEAQKARYEKLAAEATAGEERFEEIMKKWLAEKKRTIPQELQELLQQQKAACDAMIDEKEKLVNEFQQELKAKDDQYVKHLKKQAEDVDLILERMEEQARVLLRAYHQELEQIESAFTSERKELKDTHRSEWEEAVARRQSLEQSYLVQREQRIEENEAQLQHLRQHNMEEFNKIKIKLETDIQVLQQQIQQMKATFLLNAEKLEYNFQVLKKRDEENTATISQQKRKITRLQDTHNTLNTKLAKQQKAQHSELQALMEEYRKNTEQYREVQKKAKHFQMSDAKRFHDIWMMNEEKVREQAREVVHADRTIHHQQLGLGWSEPEEVASPMAQAVVRARGKLSQATLYASQVLSQAGSSQGEGLRGDGGEVSREREGEGEQEGEEIRVRTSSAILASGQVYPPATVKRVLELLCEEAGFLLDDKLTRLLAPLEKEEQMMMKLDSMFKALGIHTEEDIQKLVRHFIIEEGEGEEYDHTRGDAESTTTEGTGTTVTAGHDSTKVTLIHPNDVSLAIRHFIELRQAASKPSSLTPSTFGILSTAQKELLDGSFWQQITGVLPEEHERVWDALLEGLEKYHSTLMSRSKCSEEIEVLKRQNSELRLLLQQYMHSRINEELEIPPTLMLPIASGVH